MEYIEFDTVEYNNAYAEGYAFIEMYSTGIELKMPDGTFKKEVILVAHKTKPEKSENDIFDINDQEIDDMAHGTQSEVFYIVRT